MARAAAVLLAGLLLVGSVVSAAAVEYTTRHLAAQCTSDESAGAVSASRVGFCMGFILGVVDTYAVWRDYVNQRLEQRAGDGFCIPEDVDLHEIRAIYVGWLQRHSDRIDDTPYATVVAALAEAYPCTGTESDSL